MDFEDINYVKEWKKLIAKRSKYVTKSGKKRSKSVKSLLTPEERDKYDMIRYEMRPELNTKFQRESLAQFVVGDLAEIPTYEIEEDLSSYADMAENYEYDVRLQQDMSWEKSWEKTWRDRGMNKKKNILMKTSYAKPLKETRKFNGKIYKRNSLSNSLKSAIKKDKKSFKERGFNVIIDKDKNGYFLWTRKK